MLASGSDDGRINIWNLQLQKSVHIISEHRRGVTSLAFMPNNLVLVSGSKDGTIRLWEQHMIDENPPSQQDNNPIGAD